MLECGGGPARQLGSARQFVIVSFNSPGGHKFRHSVETRVLRWPLWGVLLTGLFSALLWEHGGNILSEHLGLLLTCLIALPLIGGVLTPEKPLYTIIVFAAGSFPPLPDANPTPIGLWPFMWALSDPKPADAIVFPCVILAAVVTAAVMSAGFAPLVYLGCSIRRWCLEP